MAVQKKQEEKSEEAKVKKEIIAEDVVVKTTGNVEVIEESAPQEVKSKEEEPDKPISTEDPLTDFKERMNQEELGSPFAPEKKNYMWPILLIFIVALVLLVGVFVYRQGIFKREKIDVTPAASSPTVIPEPTKVIDLTQYEIEVQNGSEANGEASKQQTNLEEEGFTVSSIGNADNSDYTDTIIKAKEEVDKDFIAKLESFLNTTFTVGDTEALSEDYDVPVVVIIGTKK